MSLIMDGVAVNFADLSSASWLDVAEMRVGRDDRRARVTRWIRSIIVHTTHGDEPQILHQGSGPAGLAVRTVRGWATDSRHAGAHIIIDGDGSVWCVADLIREATYHARSINEVSIGIELAQTAWLETWAVQYEALIKLIDRLTAHPKIQIQRQYHAPYMGEEVCIDRLAAGGVDAVGIFGHRDQAWDYQARTMQRGRGDPGDEVFRQLAAAGYDAFDFRAHADKSEWTKRQAGLVRFGYEIATDGVPGPATVAALLATGHKGGMWIERPGDL